MAIFAETDPASPGGTHVVTQNPLDQVMHGSWPVVGIFVLPA